MPITYSLSNLWEQKWALKECLGVNILKVTNSIKSELFLRILFSSRKQWLFKNIISHQHHCERVNFEWIISCHLYNELITGLWYSPKPWELMWKYSLKIHERTLKCYHHCSFLNKYEFLNLIFSSLFIYCSLKSSSVLLHFWEHLTLL